MIIGDWRIEPDTCLLIAGERCTKISARCMDVLVYLAERRGRVVSAEELLSRFWPSSSANDHAVHKVVAALRRALEDSAQESRYIKTLPKRGYMLIAPVSLPGGEAAPVSRFAFRLRSKRVWAGGALVGLLISLGLVAYFGTQSAPTLPAPDNYVSPSRLAILPVQGAAKLSGGERERMAELLDSLTIRLGGLHDLEVLSSTLVDAAPTLESVQNLGADHALTTAAYSGEDQVKLVVKLVKLADGVNLYAERFQLSAPTEANHVDDVVGAVVDAMEVYLDEREYREMLAVGTDSPRAYQHFRKGRFYNNQYNHRDWQRAMAHYQSAIDRDPQFVNAYLGMAKTARYMAVYSRAGRVEALHERVRELSRQLAIAVPDSPALEELKSIRLNFQGNNHYQQERNYRRAIREDRASGHVYASYALLLIGARLYEEAADYLELARSSPVEAISLNEAWNFRTQILPPDELAEEKQAQLLDRPAHIGMLGTAVAMLAFQDHLDQAEDYYRRQTELDLDGVRAHLSEVILAVQSGQIGRSQLVRVLDRGGDERFAESAHELLQPAKLGDPDFAFNNGVLSLMVGDLTTAACYWRDLTRIDKRKLVTRLHALEMFFPDSIRRSPGYAQLLEELKAGKSWQRQLMEGVMALAESTGVQLSSTSRAAYRQNELMYANNRWSGIKYPRDELPDPGEGQGYESLTMAETCPDTEALSAR